MQLHAMARAGVRLGAAKLTACDTESFYGLCRFLESLHLKTKTDKLNALEHHLRRFDATCDLYPLLRLLLPGVDHERGAYGLKESNLAKVYGEMLALPEVQKQRLLRWKDPALQEGYKCAAGDFPSVLYSVVESRATVKPGASALTIGDLNEALDKVHNASDAGEKRRQLLDLVRRASPIEQKWIAKIVLKDLKVGFTHESVLKRFHPDAMELYNRSSMLKQVLDEIRKQYIRAKEVGTAEVVKEAAGLGADEGAEDAGGGPNVGPGESILFSKFKPMLAQRLLLGQLATVINGSKAFSVEPKYDGERILVHIDCEAKRVELYTRNAIDYTSTYAPTMRSVLLGGLAGRQAVLDGEMLAWDENEQAFVPFGSNRSVAQAGDPCRHLCYMSFDVLFYTDQEGQVFDLRRTRLEARRDLLQKIVVPKEHWFEVTSSLTTSNSADVHSRLEGAIDSRLEGLVVKDMSSRYFFNARKRGWYKIKPEYDGLSETLDLLVIGGFFGDTQKRRGGLGTSTDLADNIAQFLLATLAGNGDDGERVVTIGRIGSGFSMDKLKEIRTRIRPHLRRYDPHRAPPWLGGWRGAGKSKPDAVLDSPVHGFVMEVRAAEIIPSEDYEIGHTLRFPRAVVPIREDKDWSDACTEQELRTFVREGRSQLTSRRVKPKIEVRSEGEDTDDGARGSRPSKRGRIVDFGLVRAPVRRGRSWGVLEGFRAADTALVPVASQLLKGAEVFVLNGDAQYSKADLEAYVVRHGGRTVQNYIRGRTSLVVAAAIGDLRARNLVKTAQVDIVSYNYLFQCENDGQMLPLQPRFLLSISPSTRERFAAAFDRWGDPFYEDISPATLRAILDTIQKEAAAAVPDDVVETLARHPRFRPQPLSGGQIPAWLEAVAPSAAPPCPEPISAGT